MGMEQNSKLTRQQFLKLLGAGLLSLVVAKVAALQSTITAIVPLEPKGYGSSAYGL